MQSANKEWRYLNNLEEVGFIKDPMKGWIDPSKNTRAHTIYRNGQGDLVEFDPKSKDAPDSIQAGRPDSLFYCPICHGSMTFNGASYRNAFVAHQSAYAFLVPWCAYLKRTKKIVGNLLKARKGEISSEYISQSLKKAPRAELINTITYLLVTELGENYTQKQEFIERNKELEDLLKKKNNEYGDLFGDYEDLKEKFEAFERASAKVVNGLKADIYCLKNNNEAQRKIEILESEIRQLNTRLAEVSSERLTQLYNNLDEERKTKFVNILPKTFDIQTGKYIYD